MQICLHIGLYVHLFLCECEDHVQVAVKICTHRSSFWLWVGPAGGHGADDGSLRVHVDVPPGQNHLGLATGLGWKVGGVGLWSAAHRLTEVQTGRVRKQPGEGQRGGHRRIIRLIT